MARFGVLSDTCWFMGLCLQHKESFWTWISCCWQISAYSSVYESCNVSWASKDRFSLWLHIWQFCLHHVNITPTWVTLPRVARNVTKSTRPSSHIWGFGNELLQNLLRCSCFLYLISALNIHLRHPCTLCYGTYHDSNPVLCCLGYSASVHAPHCCTNLRLGPSTVSYENRQQHNACYMTTCPELDLQIHSSPRPTWVWRSYNLTF